MGFKEDWDQFCGDVGPVLSEEMAIQAPYATGQLSASHTWRKDGDRLEIVSEDSRGPIARYVVAGTQPHPIDPVNGEYLRFVDPGGDGFIFARHVDHPGTAPDPYNQRAWEERQEEVVRHFADTVGRRYALRLLNPFRGEIK